VGVTIGSTGTTGVETNGLYLSGLTHANHDETISVFVAKWSQAGILNAEKEFARDGLLYVTFESQGTKFIPTALNPARDITDDVTEAFQGGPEADIFRDRTRNVNGFRRYIVTVMMQQNGDPLTDGDNEVDSYQAWVSYQKPGLLEISVANGPILYPGGPKWVKANIQEFLSTNGNIDDSFKPYSVRNWASSNVSFTPSATGVSVQESKGANNYLASSGGAGNNGTFWGQAVDGYAYTAFSDPIPAVYYALANQVIQSDNDPAFTTDEGRRWYRKVRVSVDGTFGQYLLS
jgi:hypothetical protein